MPTDAIELRFCRNIGLVMTYRCQVACPHCIIEAGPHRREKVDLDTAKDWINQIADYQRGHVRIFSFTGGEPFIDIDELKTLSSYVADRGMFVTAVTNAHWAETADRAYDVLSRLPALRSIAISADKYHQRRIPLERVANATKAADKLGISFSITVCTEDKESPSFSEFLNALSRFVNPDAVNVTTTFPVGRARQPTLRSKVQRVSEPPRAACWAGSSPVIFPDGRILACIGPAITIAGEHSLLLGRLNQSSFNDIMIRAEMNAVLHSLRVWGPRVLVEKIAERGRTHELPTTYAEDNACDACYEILNRPALRPLLEDLNADRAFCEYVAYGRAYYLREENMALLLGIGDVHRGSGSYPLAV